MVKSVEGDGPFRFGIASTERNNLCFGSEKRVSVVEHLLHLAIASGVKLKIAPGSLLLVNSDSWGYYRVQYDAVLTDIITKQLADDHTVVFTRDTN